MGYAGGRQSQISGYYDPSPPPPGVRGWIYLGGEQLRPQRTCGALSGDAGDPSLTGPRGRAGRMPQGWGHEPTPLWDDRVGEMSVRQIDKQGHPVVLQREHHGNMEVRVANDPTGLGATPVHDGRLRGRAWPHSCRTPAAAGDQSTRPAVRRLHLTGFHARRGAGVRQPVEHHAAGRNSLPRHPIRGEPRQTVSVHVSACAC